MPLDSHLNADHERGLKYHVALTSDYLPKKPDGSKNLQKFCLGSPEEVSSAMDRTWEVFPEPDRIISDILKYPKALKAIAEAAGGHCVWSWKAYGPPQIPSCAATSPRL